MNSICCWKVTFEQHLWRKYLKKNHVIVKSSEHYIAKSHYIFECMFTELKLVAHGVSSLLSWIYVYIYPI